MIENLKNGYYVIKDLYRSKGVMKGSNGREFPFNNIVILCFGNYADCHSSLTGTTNTYKVYSVANDLLKRSAVIYGINDYKSLIGKHVRVIEANGKVSAIEFDSDISIDSFQE